MCNLLLRAYKRASAAGFIRPAAIPPPPSPRFQRASRALRALRPRVSPAFPRWWRSSRPLGGAPSSQTPSAPAFRPHFALTFTTCVRSASVLQPENPHFPADGAPHGLLAAPRPPKRPPLFYLYGEKGCGEGPRAAISRFNK